MSSKDTNLCSFKYHIERNYPACSSANSTLTYTTKFPIRNENIWVLLPSHRHSIVVRSDTIIPRRIATVTEFCPRKRKTPIGEMGCLLLVNNGHKVELTPCSV